MIKGCQRKMIMVKGEAESPFEMAYFVLRGEVSGDACESDILAEACRIVEEKTLSSGGVRLKRGKNEVKEKNKKAILPFAAGTALGSAIGLLWLFL